MVSSRVMRSLRSDEADNNSISAMSERRSS